MLTLVVVPPALGLPSLDAECLAAISYMTNAVPEGQWEILADRQALLAGRAGTWQGLPGLWDGDKLVSGYERIVQYLKDTSCGAWDLDSHLSTKERARQYGALCTVSTRLAPLISLLLYTSLENYVKVTRPALGEMLSFPTSWVLPVHHQADQIALAARLGVSSAQLSAAAASLTKKQKLKKEEEEEEERGGGNGTLQVDPLDDESIGRPKPVTDYIPFFGSTSATLSVHRQLRQTVKDTLNIYASYAKSAPQLLVRDDETPTSLGCAVFAHLALAIAAAERRSPHLFVTSVLHAEQPELEKLVEDWMDEEWGFELRGSKAQHARKRRAAANKSRVESLPWKQQRQNKEQKQQGGHQAHGLLASSKSLLAQWLRTAGWVKAAPVPWLEARQPLRYEDGSGAVVYRSVSDRGPSRGLGYETDLVVGVTVAASTLLLGYQAWREGF